MCGRRVGADYQIQILDYRRSIHKRVSAFVEIREQFEA